MQVLNISSAQTGYDPFLLDALNLSKTNKLANITIDKTPQQDKVDRTAWQKDIINTALDKLENNIQVDNNGPLNYASAAPIDNFHEAISELKSLVTSNFEKYASQAQANLTPHDILYLFEGEAKLVS